MSTNFLESSALDALTKQQQQQQPTKPEHDPHGPKPTPVPADPKCPRCGRSIKGKLIHLVTPDQIMHTLMCGHEKCQSVISLQIDFMTMHSQMMQAMGVGQDQGHNQNPLGGRTPGGIIIPGN